MVSVRFGWNWMKAVGAAAFWKSHQKFCKVHQMNPNWTQMIRPQKHTTHGIPRTGSPKFPSGLLYSEPFSRYCIIVPFLLTWPIAKTCHSLHSPMVANVLKFGWHRIKTVGAVAFWNFQPHVVLCKKISKWPIFFFNVGRIATKSHSLYSRHKVWLKLNEKCHSNGLLNILTSEFLQSAPNDPKLNSNDLTLKVPRRSCDYESQILSVLLYGQLFSRYCTFYDFPLTPILNFKVS